MGAGNNNPHSMKVYRLDWVGQGTSSLNNIPCDMIVAAILIMMMMMVMMAQSKMMLITERMKVMVQVIHIFQTLHFNLCPIRIFCFLIRKEMPVYANQEPLK